MTTMTLVSISPIATALLLCLLNDVIIVHAEDAQLIVETDKGKVRGVTEFTLGKRVDKFLGIPYAKPPLESLRFKPPVQPDQWQGVFDASHLPNTCIQSKDTTYYGFYGSEMWNANTEISEDCLYLSVWASRTQPPFENKAVMVFIYGGSFYTGTHTLDIYNPNHLVVENDIVFVAMNYRVGSLGFLAMDTSEAPGNAGLWDQRLALEWVSRNIRNFGGDPQSVTLVSESAGSASVGLLLLCEVCNNLFHRAILQSGAPEASWASLSREDMWARSETLAKNLDCYKEGNPHFMVECMRGKQASLFPANDYVTAGITDFPFVPIVDGVFLRDDPKVLMRRGIFKKIPLLLGSNTNEITFFLVYHDVLLDKDSQTNEINGEQYRHNLLPSVFKYYPHYPHELNRFGHDAIEHQYTNWLNPRDNIAFRQSIDRAGSDAYFVCPVNRLARAYSHHELPVYYYWFDQRWTANPWPEWMGVLHGDEFWFTFGQALNATHSFTDEERELSKTMMRYWTNFAKTGNPNQPPHGEETAHASTEAEEWPRFHFDEQLYINLSTRTMASGQTRGQGPRTRECAFWDFYLPKLVSDSTEASQVREDELQATKKEFIVDWKQTFEDFIHKYQSTAATPNKKCGK